MPRLPPSTYSPSLRLMDRQTTLLAAILAIVLATEPKPCAQVDAMDAHATTAPVLDGAQLRGISQPVRQEGPIVPLGISVA